MKRRYTPSVDGVDRATFQAELRMDRGMVEDVESRAAQEGVSVAQWLKDAAWVGVLQCLYEQEPIE